MYQYCFVTYKFLCLYRVRSAEISGTTYKRKTVVVYEYVDDMPVFGEIVEIFVSPINECLFVLKLLTSLCFCAHLHSYEVGLTNTIIIARQHEFLDHYPLHTTTLNSKCFVRLKYSIVCNN